MNRGQRSILVFFVLLFACGAIIANAQNKDEWGEPSQGPADIKLAQKYTGVKPGSGNNLPRVEELKNKPGTWVTWPGFIILEDGTSRLFLQTTVPVQFAIKEKKKTISLQLRDAKVHLRNNRNPLVTVHFNTPLNRAYLKKHRRTLDLVMELRQSVSPAISQTVDNDGYHYLFVDFPPGEYPVVDTPRRTYEGYGNPGSDDDAPPETSPDEAPLDQ